MTSDLKIILQNDRYVVVDKPAMWLSVPGRFEDDRPVVGLSLQEILEKQVFPVHRLDYEVSGVMMFALTREAHKDAQQLFEKRLVKKNYQAFSAPVESRIEGVQTWKRKIRRGKKRSYKSPHGELAVTEAQVISHEKGEWLLSPKTGKSHQLRVEMFLNGYPINGDVLYGSKVPWPYGGIALRAVSLELPGVFAKAAGLPWNLKVDPFPNLN